MPDSGFSRRTDGGNQGSRGWLLHDRSGVPRTQAARLHRQSGRGQPVEIGHSGPQWIRKTPATVLGRMARPVSRTRQRALQELARIGVDVRYASCEPMPMQTGCPARPPSLRGDRSPVGGQQLIELLDRVAGHAPEHILQLRERIDLHPLAARHETGEHRRRLSALVAAN